jgi:hypothetical protein
MQHILKVPQILLLPKYIKLIFMGVFLCAFVGHAGCSKAKGVFVQHLCFCTLDNTYFHDPPVFSQSENLYCMSLYLNQPN